MCTNGCSQCIVTYMNNTVNAITFKPGHVNMPMEFDGTDEQKMLNRASHNFHGSRCMDCDCRPWGIVVDWPCGEEPPRVLVKMK